ncbi:hypothetical protein [Streptomyces brevispora]|uniref:hypothetical protein n=1 Tax=Streptomyces brevispora TaxID=887462 RepID=UPI0038295151
MSRLPNGSQTLPGGLRLRLSDLGKLGFDSLLDLVADRVHGLDALAASFAELTTAARETVETG